MTGNVLEYALDNIDDNEDPLMIFDEAGGNPVGFNRSNLVHYLQKGGGVDEGEEAYPIANYTRLCGG